MKAISLWQPWATLMALGKKRIETRSWPTSHRGELAIHAARRCDHGMIFAPTFREVLIGQSIPCGAIVAVLNVTDCRSVEWIHGQDFFDEVEREFGDYTPGLMRYGWLTDNLRQLPNPVVCKGSQRIWNLPIEVETQVRGQL